MEIAGIAIFVILSIAGLILIIAGIPGTLFILAGSFIYALLTKFASLDWKMLAVLLLMSLFAETADNIMSMLGAKKAGASGAGSWSVLAGSIAGAVIGGMFFPVAGSLIGAFAGGAAAPVIMEYLRRRNLQSAVKAGMGALAGRMGGILIKIFISIAMIITASVKIF